MNGNDKQTYLFLYVLGSIPVIWIALLLAPYLIQGGIFDHLAEMNEALNNPLKIHWMENSLRTILLFLCIYIAGIGIYYATKKNYRRGEEHGSAKWGECEELCVSKNRQV